MRNGPQVLAGDMVTMIQDGLDLGGQDQGLCTPRTGAVADVLARQRGGAAGCSGCVAISSAMP